MWYNMIGSVPLIIQPMMLPVESIILVSITFPHTPDEAMLFVMVNICLCYQICYSEH